MSPGLSLSIPNSFQRNQSIQTNLDHKGWSVFQGPRLGKAGLDHTILSILIVLPSSETFVFTHL